MANADGYTNPTFSGFARAYLLDRPWDHMGDARRKKVSGGVSHQVAEEEEK